MADAGGACIDIEVVYALPQEQIVVALTVEAGTTVAQALEQSGLLQRFPEISADKLDVGIYGKRADPSAILREYDRVEIYRPLIADPKQARRARTKPKLKRKR